jgi:hypothetical protein
VTLFGLGVNFGPVWTNVASASDLQGRTGSFGGSVRLGKVGVGVDIGFPSTDAEDAIYIINPYYGVGLAGEFHGGATYTWTWKP